MERRLAGGAPDGSHSPASVEPAGDAREAESSGTAGESGGASAAIEEAPPPFDEATEAAFLAESREAGGPAAAPAKTANVRLEDSGPLPPLDELVAKIPAEVRETLDELFRAKFITVRRIPPQALK